MAKFSPYGRLLFHHAFKKTWYKKNTRLFIIGTPANYFHLLEADVQNQVVEDMEKANFYHIFTPQAKEL